MFSEIFEFSKENSYFERIRKVRMVRMVRMVRSLADRTFQLCPGRTRARRSPVAEPNLRPGMRGCGREWGLLRKWPRNGRHERNSHYLAALTYKNNWIFVLDFQAFTEVATRAMEYSYYLMLSNIQKHSTTQQHRLEYGPTTPHFELMQS